MKPATFFTLFAMKEGKVTSVQRVWLTMDEACKYLGVTRYYIMERRTEGQLQAYKVGNKLFFKVEDIDRMIRRGKTI